MTPKPLKTAPMRKFSVKKLGGARNPVGMTSDGWVGNNAIFIRPDCVSDLAATPPHGVGRSQCWGDRDAAIETLRSVSEHVVVDIGPERRGTKRAGWIDDPGFVGIIAAGISEPMGVCWYYLPVIKAASDLKVYGSVSRYGVACLDGNGDLFAFILGLLQEYAKEEIENAMRLLR